MRWIVIGLALLCACSFEETVEPDDDEPTEEEPEDEPMPPPPGPVTLVPGCTATATLAGHSMWMFFVRPDDPCRGTAGSGVDHHAIEELIRLIGSVPAGGRIDGHIFNITIDGVGKALLEAQQRGVDVRISTDGQVARSTDSVKTEYLDQLAGIVYCTSADSDACVSSAADAISHTKLFAFSTATTPDEIVANDVVWFGSANQTYASGTKLYNNTVTLYGDTGLYGLLRDYLDDLRERARTADYYDPSSGRGHLLATSADVYASPESTTDLVVNRLDDITPDGDCEIRVMQASIRDSRLAVVDQLARLAAGGCTISVVADTLEPAALAGLKAAGIAVREMPIHDKVFIVRARYGATLQHRVYTGSHNLSGSANRKYDEIFVKLAPEPVDAHPVYDAYVAHFDGAFGKGAPR